MKTLSFILKEYNIIMFDVAYFTFFMAKYLK